MGTKNILRATADTPTLKQIADDWGVSYTMVWEIQVRAIKKFKAELKRRGIKFEDLFAD
jgi:DNA-directed RNA polymerase specialized sigma subunit